MDIVALASGILSSLPLGLIWSIMTIGLFVTFRVLDFADLTVDGSLTTGAAVSVVLIFQGFNPFVAVLVSFCIGMVAGLATALLHTKLKIPPLLSGILTMTALYSINLRIMGKANVSINKQTTVYSFFANMGVPKKIELPYGMVFSSVDVLVMTLFFVVLVFVVLYWFFGTEVGYAIRATGDNPQMIRAQGVNTHTTTVIGLMLSNGLVAVAGSLLAQNQKFAEVSMGVGTIVVGLASVIIGEVLFGKNSFKRRLVSIIIGSLVYRMIIAVVLEFGMNPNDIKLFTAVIIAVALSLPLLQRGIVKTRKARSHHVANQSTS